MNALSRVALMTWALLASAAAAQDGVTHARPTSAVNVSPLGLAFGRAGGSIEHVFGVRHGMVMEGWYAREHGHGVTLALRRHYASEAPQQGVCAPYWGPFLRFSRSSSEIRDPDTDQTYDLDIRAMHVGLAWGSRRSLGHGLNLSWRAGYGIPVATDLEWSPEKPDFHTLVEVLVTVLGGIDGELSVGFAF